MKITHDELEIIRNVCIKNNRTTLDAINSLSHVERRLDVTIDQLQATRHDVKSKLNVLNQIASTNYKHMMKLTDELSRLKKEKTGAD